jgi:hypothetical protein
MENNSISKHTVSFGLSLALCAVLNGLLVIAKERSKAVAGLLQKVTGHHWITHVGVILILFVVFGGFFAAMHGGRGPQMPASRLTGTVVAGAVAGVILVLGFYLIAG